MTHPLLFAVGDGNHSLATAKSIWEEVKPNVGIDHPARYALVELVNLHDPSLKFEPIHRVMFNVGEGFGYLVTKHFDPNYKIQTVDNFDAMKELVLNVEKGNQRIGMLTDTGYRVIELTAPKQNLAAGSIQEFLDAFLLRKKDAEIDYVHGDDVLIKLSQEPGNFGFYLPPLKKDNFFKSVILDGSLPRKTFSMGHARDKRFYLEARRIN
jgi:hypothetical protein